ncbi:hypothetical protein [Salipaludibacillus aurantiacus]|uniref:Uncharacterized protein n=1 Tax=Salipaludibacillus aurantiacus TaxID=1601833 RepID=A0A1H9Q921_9BACI|nr:hypothetical protein [Salipaludibacillus aurantiacus]SER56655.1 hypothetical protein SAMN05518684_10282 [Salipaludibacillus aurantiacus]
MGTQNFITSSFEPESEDNLFRDQRLLDLEASQDEFNYRDTTPSQARENNRRNVFQRMSTWVRGLLKLNPSVKSTAENTPTYK